MKASSAYIKNPNMFSPYVMLERILSNSRIVQDTETVGYMSSGETLDKRDEIVKRVFEEKAVKVSEDVNTSDTLFVPLSEVFYVQEDCGNIRERCVDYFNDVVSRFKLDIVYTETTRMVGG